MEDGRKACTHLIISPHHLTRAVTLHVSMRVLLDLACRVAHTERIDLARGLVNVGCMGVHEPAMLGVEVVVCGLIHVADVMDLVQTRVGEIM